MKLQLVAALLSLIAGHLYAESAYQVAERGDNYTVMQRVTTEFGTNHVHKYTVLGNGMNRQDEAGNWVECQPVIQDFQGGILCSGASYRVILNHNLNTYGAIDFEAADTNRIVSSPLGIGFYDPETGKSVILAQITNCLAELVSSNQIFYRDAFQGNGFRASVTYTYDAGRFHQDVTFAKRPSFSPEDYGMGSQTRLEIFTEITSGQLQVEKTGLLRSNSKQLAVSNETFKVGNKMGMNQGYAFPLDGSKRPLKNRLPVAKSLVQSGGRTILVESVEWADAQTNLAKLPIPTESIAKATQKVQASRTFPPSLLRQPQQLDVAFLERVKQLAHTGHPIVLASNNSGHGSSSGFVVDYEIMYSMENYAFWDGTYFIQNEVDLTGITDFNGLIVVKFDDSGNYTPALFFNGSFETDNGGPFTFTSESDDSVGEKIDGSTGDPSPVPASVVFDGELWGDWIGNFDCRFMWAGLEFWCGSQTFELGNVYVRNCGEGIDFSFGSQNNVTIDNLYYCGVNTLLVGQGDNSIDVENSGEVGCDDFDADGLPDSWERQYLGSLSWNGGSLDTDGNTLLYDYTNNIVPANDIPFILLATNLYVRTNVVTTTLDFLGGFPYSVATSVGSQESTNFGTATWNRFTSFQLTNILGTTDGVYAVWAGVRGVSSTSDQTWHSLNFVLDRIPPTIAITNLINGANVSVSLVQVQGWASEPLASIVYDLTNADGLVTNQEAFVTGQQVDTNLTAFSTNYFQAYDIFLAEGTNTFTFRATDLAGNTSTTNLTVILNSSAATNAPMVTVNWPDTNTPIAGTNFTLTGTVDDPTATVLVSGNGFTNLIATVERDGRFIVAGVPLLASNNTFVVNATNKTGHVTASSAGGLMTSGVILTVDPIQSSQISQGSVTLTGTVSDIGKDVWVNGLKAIVHADGTWKADNLPVNDHSGTMQLNIGAYPPNSDPNTSIPSGVENPIVPLPPVCQVSGYTSTHFFWNSGGCEGPNWNIDDAAWMRGSGGWVRGVQFTPPDQLTSYGDVWGEADLFPELPWVNLSTSSGSSQAVDGSGGCETFVASSTETKSVRTSVEVVAGGPAVPGQMQLVRLTVAAKSYSGDPDGGSEGDVPVLGSKIQIFGQPLTPTATNDQVGELYLAMPTGSAKALLINVVGVDSYSFDVHAEANNVKILANGIDLSTNTPEFCVGQQIIFTLEGLPGYTNHVTLWKFPTNYVNDENTQFVTYSPATPEYSINSSFLTNLPSVTNWYVEGAGGTVSVRSSLILAGHEIALAAKGGFTIYRPTCSDFDNHTNLVGFFWDGSTLTANMRWSVTVHSKYNGVVGATQILNIDGGLLDTGGFDYLDGDTIIYSSQSYQTNNPPSWVYELDDNPQSPVLIPCGALDGNFNDYLRFQPSGANSIYVTLATNGWTMVGHYCVGAVGPTNISPASVLLNVDKFPDWDGVRHGHF